MDEERQKEEEVTKESKRSMMQVNGKGIFFTRRGTVSF